MARTMRTSATVARELSQQLGITPDAALELLREAGGEQAAIALHERRSREEAGPSNHQSSALAIQLQTALQEMGLPLITPEQATRLLSASDNSVERAVENYLEDPSLAGPRGASAAAGAGNDDDPIVIISSSDDSSDSGDSSSSEDSSSSDDSSDNEDAARNAQILARIHPYIFAAAPSGMPSAPDSSSSDSSDDDSSIDSSDSSDVEFETEEEMFAAAAAAYDAHFKQQVVSSSGDPTEVTAAADQKRLPSIEEAFYRAARDYSRKVPKSKLPFAAFRQSDGGLYRPPSPGEEVPSVALPQKNACTEDEFLLGTVLLPVHSVNADLLKKLDKQTTPGTPLQWGAASPNLHDYVLPVHVPYSDVWAEQLSPLFDSTSTAARDTLFVSNAPVQLSLGGPKLADTDPPDPLQQAHSLVQMPAVTVRSSKSWVKQFISAVGHLEKNNVIAPVYTLVGRGNDEDDEEEIELASGSKAGGSRKRPLSSPPQADTTTSPGASGSKKKTKVGAKGTPTKTLSAKKQLINTTPGAKSTPRSLGLPTHVKVAVYTTQSYASQYIWNRDAPSDMEDKLRSHPKKHTIVYLLSALLAHGGGTLRLGPDSDGILNVGDIPTKEAETVDKMSDQELASQFNVGSILDSISDTPEMTAKRGLAPRPPGLLSNPKRYQLSGLQWMLDREQKGDARDRGVLALHPSWVQLVSESGHVFYFDRTEKWCSWRFYTAPPQGTCGGFICDEMGLGKSLQTLMLVKQNPPPPGWAVEDFSGEDMTVSATEPVPIKTTLLVAPTTLLTQWEEEIGKHLAPGTLRYGRFVDPFDRKAMAALMQQAPNAEEVASLGKRARRAPRRSFGPSDVAATTNGASGSTQQKRGRSKKAPAEDNQVGVPLKGVVCALPDGSVAEIQTLDICLCSYEDLRDQLSMTHRNNLSALQQFGYWRVCLDEAQLIANSSSVAAVMASSLWRRHAWVVTGTPISNRLSEVRGLLEFLALEPYFHSSCWNALVQNSCDDMERHGLLSLRSLLRGVMLRRSKKDVANELDLPPCTREDLSVVLSTAERAAYERLKREFLDAVKQYKRHHDASANFVRNEHNNAEETSRNRALAKASARTYASLTSLRQSTCHPQMVAANTALLGSERLSMTDIIDRLVTQAYGEFDTALRAVFDALVYQLAVGASLTGDDPATCFDSLMQSIDDNALIAGLLMLPRNDVISLRNETGSLNRAAFGGAEEVVVRQRLVALENADAEECLQEDDELEEAREVYRQQLNEIAEKWDKENADKEGPKKKKAKGGGRNKNANGSGSGGGASGAAGAAGGGNNDGGEPVATRTGPSFKAKRYARNELGPMPDLPPRRRQLRREAATRRRNWDRFKLAILELKLHLIKEELGIVKSKWTDEAKERAAERKELGESNPQASFEATVQELDTLRAELGLIPDFGPTTTATKSSPGGASGSKSAAGASGSGSGAGGSEAIPKDTTTNGNEGYEHGADTTADALAAAALIDNAAHIRRSRRQAGIDADSTAEITLDPEELAAQLENAVIMVRQYKSMCAGRKPAELVQRHRDTAETEAKELFHRLKFVQQQHKDVTRLANMTAAANGGASGSGGAGAEEQDDLTRCPICFDDLTTTPLTMTRCSHRFCTDCISESLQRAAPQPAPCPICRTELRQSDLFEALSEAEAVVAARAAAATNSATSEYGAKVAAVLDILRDMKEDSEGAKCVIFSSWGRALRLVGDALTANRVKFASLVGASTKRAAFLDEFMHDPECTVLLVLMSTSGGAAGLTLVNATTAILLEPCFNPGLEAQAAARIHRMGQTRPTRVVRLIAEESVDVQIAEEQRRKFEAGDTAAGNIKSDEADYGTIVALADRLAASATVAEAMEEDTGPAARPGGDDGAGPSQPGRVINASRRR